MDLINIGIIITYIMISGAALAVLGFSVIQMTKSPDNAKKTLYTIGGLLVVLIITLFVNNVFSIAFALEKIRWK